MAFQDATKFLANRLSGKASKHIIPAIMGTAGAVMAASALINSSQRGVNGYEVGKGALGIGAMAFSGRMMGAKRLFTQEGRAGLRSGVQRVAQDAEAAGHGGAAGRLNGLANMFGDGRVDNAVAKAATVSVNSAAPVNSAAKAATVSVNSAAPVNSAAAQKVSSELSMAPRGTRSMSRNRSAVVQPSTSSADSGFKGLINPGNRAGTGIAARAKANAAVNVAPKTTTTPANNVTTSPATSGLSAQAQRKKQKKSRGRGRQ